MLSITNLLCGHQAGNEPLRYGHTGTGGVGATRTSGIPKPVVVWALTRACNLHCVHCYASATAAPDAGELTRHEGMNLLDDLREFGVPAVLLSGGEPLTRPEALDFIAHAQSIGLATTLSTNGLLIDDAMADRLAKSGLRYVGISLDGIESRHDKLRGKQGAFAASLAAIDRCRSRGIKVGARFTVHALNWLDMDAIFDICLEHNVQRLCVYHLAYSGRGGNMQNVDLTPDQIRSIVDRIFQRSIELHKSGRPLEVLTVDNHADAAYMLLRMERDNDPRLAEVQARLRGTGGNRSGCNIASIDPKGNVHYDQFSWHYNCGNVREQHFSTIWSQATDPRLAILRNRRAYLPQRCQSCRFVDVCNGNLRTRAEAATGDWMGFDPGCYLTEAETTTPIVATTPAEPAAAV